MFRLAVYRISPSLHCQAMSPADTCRRAYGSEHTVTCNTLKRQAYSKQHFSQQRVVAAAAYDDDLIATLLCYSATGEAATCSRSQNKLAA